MKLPVKVVELDGTESSRPYLLRLMGWTEEQIHVLSDFHAWLIEHLIAAGAPE